MLVQFEEITEGQSNDAEKFSESDSESLDIQALFDLSNNNTQIAEATYDLIIHLHINV